MSTEADLAGLEKLLTLLNAEDKKTAEKLCRDLVVERKDLVQLILAGRAGALEPYKYACHFAQIHPEHLRPTPRDDAALGQNGIGPLAPRAAKAVRKMFQTFEERRMFAAHLFYLPGQDIWHLFYFDQRDLDEHQNHWTVGGSHIHYSRECFTQQSLAAVWGAVCGLPPNPPGSLHVRFEGIPGEEAHG